MLQWIKDEAPFVDTYTNNVSPTLILQRYSSWKLDCYGNVLSGKVDILSSLVNST